MIHAAHSYSLSLGSLSPFDQQVCEDDSGGPLAVRSRDARVHQVGVVSFGPRTCNLLLFLGPTVYERIDAHLKWILDHTTDATYCSG